MWESSISLDGIHIKTKVTIFQIASVSSNFDENVSNYHINMYHLAMTQIRF